ncbi:MAG: TolC family protein, partial [Candidatus Omnitrophica bacterium]|nr:TolC family protein [Candidatus Omnitrophota bacterium]
MRRFFIIGLALAIILTKAAHAEAIEPSDAFVVKGIEYESLDGTARLDIETNDRVTYITYELESPYRIIIDPLDPIWCDYSESVYFDEGIVRSIKFVRGRDISEGPGKPYYPFDFVSVELRSPYPYKLSEVDSIITLNIGKTALPPKAESEFIPAESSGLTAEPEGITETPEWEIEEAAEGILAEDRVAVDTVEGKFLKEKKAIDIAKDELQKKMVFLEREGFKLARERKLLKKDREALEDKRVELKKRKIEPRPVKEYKDKPVEPDYLSKVLTLDDCIQIAISNNLHVKAMNERVKLAKMKVNEAFRELFPEFTLMMDESGGMISNQYYKGRKLGFEFKQVIFHGGEQVYLWEQSKVNLKVAKENLQKTKEEIVFEATKTYYELAKAVNKYKHQEELLESINTDFNIAKKEHELELMSQIDFMNVGSSMNQASHTLVSYKNNISLAKLELKKTMNVDMRHDIKTDSELELKDVDVDLNECMDLALKYKPEYRVSYLNTEATKLAEKVAKSQEFPQVDIFAKYLKSAERLEPSHLLRRHLKNERALGATVSMPFGP